MIRRIVAPVGVVVHFEVTPGEAPSEHSDGCEPIAEITSVWIGGRLCLPHQLDADDLVGIQEALDEELAKGAG